MCIRDSPYYEYSHAVSWTPAGGMMDLGTLGNFSEPYRMNKYGQVVGFSAIDLNNNQVHAFSWTLAGGMTDLGTLGGGFSYAVAVNDKGQIAGTLSLIHISEPTRLLSIS